eukprot:11615529-Ditylum_brightwellii.AAC.1
MASPRMERSVRRSNVGLDTSNKLLLLERLSLLFDVEVPFGLDLVVKAWMECGCSIDNNAPRRMAGIDDTFIILLFVFVDTPKLL